MNARQLEQISDSLNHAAEAAGYSILRLWPMGRGFGLEFRRLDGRIAYEEEAKKCTSERGRVNFTVACTSASVVEIGWKKELKAAIRAAVPAVKNCTIVGLFADHHDKLVVLPGGVAFNQ